MFRHMLKDMLCVYGSKLNRLSSKGQLLVILLDRKALSIFYVEVSAHLTAISLNTHQSVKQYRHHHFNAT